MSDFKKMIELLSETTVAGNVAPMSTTMGEAHKRIKEPAEESKDSSIIEYGNWENTSLVANRKLEKQRKHAVKVVKSIYGEDVKSEAANPKQQAAIAIAKKKEVAEGKWTVNARTGAKLDPRTGAELPPKPLTMKQMFSKGDDREPEFDVDLDDVWREFTIAASNVAPDIEPYEDGRFAQWLKNHGITGFKIGDVLDAAAKKHGYDSWSDYYDSMKDQYARDQGVAEGRWLKPKAEKPPKSVSTMTLRQLEKNKRENPGQSPFRTQDEKVKKYLGLEEEGVAEGSLNENQEWDVYTVAQGNRAELKGSIIAPDENAAIQAVYKDPRTYGYVGRAYAWVPFVKPKSAPLPPDIGIIYKKIVNSNLPEKTKRMLTSMITGNYPGGKDSPEQYYKTGKFSPKVQQYIDKLSGQGVVEAHGNSKIYDKCWPGHRKVPGKGRGEEGSCEKIGEDALEESDLILNPSSMSKKVRDLIPHEQNRTDHEVQMAKSDLHQSSKNALEIFRMIRDVSEEQGLEGWVQEKIIKAADYLNTVREYLEGKELEKSSLAFEGAEGSPKIRKYTKERPDGSTMTRWEVLDSKGVRDKEFDNAESAKEYLKSKRFDLMR